MAIAGVVRGACGLFLMAAMVLLPAGAADGQDSLADVLEPRLSRIDLDRLAMAAELTHDQRLIVNLLFTDYDDQLEQLIEETDALADEYGRQEVQAAFAGRLHLPQAELHAKRRDVLSVFADALPVADDLLGEVLASFDAILMPEQQPGYRAALRQLRRMLLFEPLRADEQSYDYAGDGIDVLALLEQAMSPRGEFEKLDPAKIAPAVESYERQLDSVLGRAFAAHRDSAMQRRIANIGRGADVSLASDRQLVESWRVLFDLNETTMEAIAGLAAADVGPEAAQMWRWRFQQAIFPWLYRPRRPDRFVGWIERDGAVSPETETSIREICRAFSIERDELVAEAASLMLTARFDHSVIVHSMTDPARITDSAQRALYQELLRNSGELSKLETDATKRVEALLNENQRRSLERYLRSSR